MKNLLKRKLSNLFFATPVLHGRFFVINPQNSIDGSLKQKMPSILRGHFFVHNIIYLRLKKDGISKSSPDNSTVSSTKSLPAASLTSAGFA